MNSGTLSPALPPLFVYWNAWILVCCLAWTGQAFGDDMRIVSLAPSNTSMIEELRLDDTLVGITTFCERPANATDAEVIGTINQPNLEFIATLKPTLVVADRESNQEEALAQLERMGMDVVRLGPADSLESIKRDFLALAEATKTTETAEAIVDDFDKKLHALTKRIEGKEAPVVFVEIWPNPLITISEKAFIHHVLTMAGGKNPFADTAGAYPKISMESVIAARPDAIVILTHSLVDDSRIEAYRTYPSLQETAIHQVDSAEASQPSLLHFLSTVELLIDLIHPESEPMTP